MTLYLRDTDLAKRYSVSRSTVWRWTREGLLPNPVQLSHACSRWRLDEIEACDAERDSGKS